MSCSDCERIQAGPRGEECYVRVGVSNMLIVGCRSHLTEVLDALRYARNHVAEWKPQDTPPAQGTEE